MSAPIDPKNVGSFSVINNRVYLTPDFTNGPAARHQRVVEAERQRQSAGAKKRAQRQAEKDKKRPRFGASILTGALTVFFFAGISFLFGVPLVGSGLGGLGGLILFCAWMDYDEKVRKWQERQNAEINAKLEEIRRISAPSSSPAKELSTEELLNEIRRREARGEN